MIIFGTRGVTWNGESGEFVCPGCGGTTQQYTRKTIRRFFTLYFIPLIPLDRYVLDMSGDLSRTLDRRIALALGVMLDTGERR